jgi:outer membrane receptor protein involved in Fe transport
MKNYPIIILTITLILGLSNHSFGSTPEASQRPRGAAMGIVTGKVIDSTTNEPVEFANILFFSQADSTLVTGGISGQGGIFAIEQVPFGRYYTEVKFIGFETSLPGNFAINPQQMQANLGTIELTPTMENLEAVVITGERAMLTHNLDRRVYNVGSDINAEGGSALEIMERLPSVEVDMEGNVSLRGSSNVTILVDGRPSTYSSVDQIPANIIESVEIITNPSARFSPDGLSGIINIVLKKRREPGYHGMLSLNAGTGDKYMGSLNFNYRQNNINLFTNLSYRHFRMAGLTLLDRTTINGNEEITSLLGQSQNFRRGGDFGGINGGIDYFLSKASTITLSGGYNANDFIAWEESETNLSVLFPNVTSDSYFRENDGDNNFSSANFALNYRLNGNGSGREFNADVFYNKWNGSFANNTLQWWPDNSKNAQQEQSANNFKVNTFTFQSDLVQPIGNGGRLEAGLRAMLRNQDSDYAFFNFVGSSPVEDLNRSNLFVYDEQQYSAYAIYSNSLIKDKLSYQGGLRLENSNTIADQRTTGLEPVERSFLSLFPSAHIRWNINQNSSAQIAYSRRLNRPQIQLLNPFINYSDPLNRSTGNPMLNPEITNSYELSYNNSFAKTRFSASTYYRQTTDIISRFVQIETDPIGGFDYAMSTFVNIDSSNTLGLEAVVSQVIAPWWRLNLSGNLNYVKLFADYLDKDSSQGSSWSSRFTSTFNVGKNLEFQLTGNYRSPSVSVGGGMRYWQTGGGQGRTEEMYWFDLGARLNVMNRKGTVTLRVSDLLNTMTYRAETWGQNFSSNIERNRDSRVLWVGFSYRINEYRVRRDRQAGTDEMSFE